MRVLVIAPSFPSDRNPVNGIFMKTQVDALARAGAQVEVVGPIPWVPPGLARLRSRWRRYAETPREATVGDVRVVRPRYLEVPRGSHWAAPHRAFTRLALREAKERPDVVHAHFAYPGGVAAVGTAAAWQVPSVVTLHGSDVNVFPNVNSRTRRRFRDAVRGASAVIAVSQELGDRTEALAGRRPLLMPIGIDQRAYEKLPRRDLARHELGLPLQSPLVLYVGNLLPAKGIRELIEALGDLRGRGIVGVFVGEGPLRSEVETVPGALVAGLQPNHRIPLYLAAADLLVLPSYSEGMPTALIEAGAARLPVAATPVGGVRQLLDDGRGLMFPPRSAKALGEAILASLDAPDAARARADRLAGYVRQEYDVDKNAGSLLSLYGELIRAGSARGSRAPRDGV